MTTLGAHLDARPFALAMSSGFFGFFAHAGVLCALDEAGLRPIRLSGSSAGALVTGAYAAGVAPRDLAEALLGLDRAAFWDPSPGAGLLRGARFRARLESLLPVDDFAACSTPLAVSAFDARRRRTRVLDAGRLVPAIYASCAVPLLFQPIRHEGGLLVDGGVRDRPGLAGMPRDIPVLHHHLASRSPWRRQSDPAHTPPKRDGLVALVLPDLPRSGPFALDAGRAAYEMAYDRARRALDREVGEIVVG